MSDLTDPPRMIDGPEGDLLKTALEGARADVPDASTIEAMLARFPPIGGGPSGPAHPPAGPSAPPAPPVVPVAAPLVPGLGKLAAALAVAGALGGGAYLALRSDAPKTTATASSTAVVAASASPESSASAVATTPSAVPTPSMSAPPTTPRSANLPPAPSASADTGGPTEIELLREAQAALASSPSRALELTSEHQRRFPRGSLGQERDMIRIQALLATGHADEARAMADDFRRRHPDSAHNGRLDDLFPPR